MLDFTVYKFDGFFRNYGINGPQREKNIEKIKNYIKWNNQVHEPQMQTSSFHKWEAFWVAGWEKEKIYVYENHEDFSELILKTTELYNLKVLSSSTSHSIARKTQRSKKTVCKMSPFRAS